MLKQQVKKAFLFGYILILMFGLSPFALGAREEQIPVFLDSEQSERIIHSNIHVKDNNIEPINTSKVKKGVVPNPSRKAKK